jgi:hypothetical protein
MPSSFCDFPAAKVDSFYRLNDAVQLYLAIEDEQRRLAQLNEQLVEEGLDAPQHDMDYIIQSSKVEEMKEACRGLLTALPPARPKTPDLRAMGDWIEECRADFEACKAFCDAWSPLEEGEIDPQVERLLSRCNKLQCQVERLQERSKARMAAIEDHTVCNCATYDGVCFIDAYYAAQRARRKALRV